MEKPREQDTQVEMVPLNDAITPAARLPDVNILDQKDGIDTVDQDLQKSSSPDVSFIQKMGKTMEQYILLAKVGIFIVGGILFLLFLVWNLFFPNDEKTIRDETMTKLVKVMQMQGAGSFSPIIEHASNITAIGG